MLLRWWGRRPHADLDAAMREFTAARDAATEDELWIVEHDPVFTLGLAGRSEHVLNPGDIPVVQTNRGGQVTYHGPGQVVAYPLVDLQRLKLSVKEHVFRLEQAALDTLLTFDLTGNRLRGAPGIYVRLADPRGHERLLRDAAQSGAFDGLGKIAALGVKVSRHRSYHGLALNVAMDLEPFQRINPCGYAGLISTDLRSCGVEVSWEEAAQTLARQLGRLFAA